MEFGRDRDGLAHVLSERFGVAAASIQAKPADHVEALGRNVLQVAADELVARQRQHLLAPLIPVILVTEVNGLAVEADQSAFADRSAVKIPAEVVEHRARV